MCVNHIDKDDQKVLFLNNLINALDKNGELFVFYTNKDLFGTVLIFNACNKYFCKVIMQKPQMTTLLFLATI